jgi:hypothetical protein
MSVWITGKIFNFTANNSQPRFMDINKQPLTIHEIKLLVKAKQERYQAAIKNNISFDKLKAMHESINELKMLLQKRKGK